jgi:hypothetical protein
VTGDFGIVTAGFGAPGKIGHDQPKSAVTFNRNGRSRSAEMGGHVRPKYAPADKHPALQTDQSNRCKKTSS